MYKESFAAAAGAAQKKFNLLKTNPAGYVVLSILAGMYIGFGILLAFTVGGQLGTNPVANLIKGLIFGVALSLVVIPGAELFTGNNFVMSAGLLEKKVKLGQVGFSGWFAGWATCWGLESWLGCLSSPAWICRLQQLSSPRRQLLRWPRQLASFW